MQTLKIYLLLVIFTASHITTFGQLKEDELKQFKRDFEIADVRVDTWKSDEDRAKFERLEVNTFQNEDDPVNYDMTRFRMRLVVELTDKDKKTYLVQFTGNAPGEYDSEYMGEDYWNLFMAHGDLERLKVSGYMIQYGIMDGDTFIPLAEEEKGSEKMLEGVRNRTTVLFQGKIYLRHYYMYVDSGSGPTESTPVNIRRIKE